MNRRQFLKTSALALLASNANSAETDQYMTHNIELKDSTNAINKQINLGLNEFLEESNQKKKRIETPQELTQEFYVSLFKGALKSELKTFLEDSPQIDRFPKDEISNSQYRNESIYRNKTFPFILPMARTIQMNDIYFGIDKFCHFFGFGREYLKDYQKFTKKGLNEKDAKEKMIKIGLRQERIIVGGFTDGIVSYADLEANFQGFELARELSNQDNNYFQNNNGKWSPGKEIDLTPYITPDFDETWNQSKFQRLRKRYTSRVIEQEYSSDEVKESLEKRFENYSNYPESFSKKFLRLNSKN